VCSSQQISRNTLRCQFRSITRTGNIRRKRNLQRITHGDSQGSKGSLRCRRTSTVGAAWLGGRMRRNRQLRRTPLR
jgi:hypothetical protein